MQMKNEQNNTVSRLTDICNQFSDILGLVILFGSYSRGEEDANSDIDLYVEPKDISMTTDKFSRSKSYRKFKFALYDGLDKDFDLLTYGGVRDITAMRRSPLWKQIEKEGILIYGQRAESL